MCSLPDPRSCPYAITVPEYDQLAASWERQGEEGMACLMSARIFVMPVDLAVVRQHSVDVNGLEITLLRHQLRLVQRKQPTPHLSHWGKLTLAVLAARLAGPEPGVVQAGGSADQGHRVRSRAATGAGSNSAGTGV